jgi:N-carbamoylputrescine amidase
VTNLRVALLQMRSHGFDQDANLAKGIEFCRQAKNMRADVALFPEMWNVGYTSFCPDLCGPEANVWRAPERWGSTSVDSFADSALVEARRQWAERAVGPGDVYVARFRDLARELEMAIAVTYLERWPGGPRNTVSLIDRRGEIVLTYAKVHTCDFDAFEASLTPGDDFPVCRLETAAGEVAVGAMICYDREFPESARILMLNGAEIVLTPNACGLGLNRLTQFRTRAGENLIGVAMANYAAPEQNGHSVAYDGMPFDECGRDRDMLLVEAGEGEGVFLADFDLAALRAYRQREPWGNAFRRPHRYGALTAPTAVSPFLRTNAAGTPYHETRR